MIIKTIMSKYLDNKASESESVVLMNALYESSELRAQFQLAAAGINRIQGRQHFGKLR